MMIMTESGDVRDRGRPVSAVTPTRRRGEEQFATNKLRGNLSYIVTIKEAYRYHKDAI